MSPTVLLLIALIIYGLLSTHFSVRRSKSPQERSASLRFAVFGWLIGILFVAVLFLPIPGKHRLLYLAPLFFVWVAVRKVLGQARARIREEERLQVDIERMKRVD
jgi:predicted permease